MAPTKRLLLLGLGSLLLAACGQGVSTAGQPQPVVTVPVGTPVAQAPAGLGLYELHITARPGVSPTARVSRVGGGPVSAQEIGGLSFGVGMVATNNDAGGNKHYSAVINVTNGAGRDIASPLYVPVAISSYTQNGTYFTGARADNGSTTTDPTGVSIEQAYYSNAGSIETDPNATPLVTTNVAPSLFGVPSGTSVSDVSPRAWQAPALPNGGSQSVKFGFAIPTGNATYSFNVVFGVFATPAVNHLVISQVYGGGGSTSISNPPTYKNDYIELFNPTNGVITIAASSMSLQYGAATSVNYATSVLPAATIQPGAYYLVKQATAANATGGTLSGEDATGNLNMSATLGKVALASKTTAITGTGDAAVVDFVGYGTSANAYEGSGAAPAPSITTSIFRAANGCADTNNNSSDFTAAAPVPRNSSTAANLCQ